MKTKTFGSAALVLVLAGGAVAYAFTRAPERGDCPGKLICPLTGEEICKDRCPLSGSSSSGSSSGEPAPEVPSCCRKVSE